MTAFPLFRTFLLLVLLSVSSRAADEVLHWYQVTVQDGTHAETFTGASENDADFMENAIIGGKDMVKLVHLREFGNFDGAVPKWRENSVAKEMRISPRAVVYFTILAGDPLAKDPKPSSGR